MSAASEFLDEIMRRVEENWGENASEGPYAKQEIVEGVREIITEFKADIDRVVGRAAGLVSESMQPDWPQLPEGVAYDVTYEIDVAATRPAR